MAKHEVGLSIVDNRVRYELAVFYSYNLLISGSRTLRSATPRAAPATKGIQPRAVSIELFQTVKKIRQERHGNAKDKPKVQY